MRKTTPKRKRRSGVLEDKEILKFFPKPSRMGQPVLTRWEKISIFQTNPKGRQTAQNAQNSY
jgi:hypothetical protein